MGNALLTVPIDVTPLIIFRLCPDQTRLSLRHHLCTGKQRVRAFVKTLLLYALVGPLVGLLSLVPIAVLVVAWDTIADWLAFSPARKAHRATRRMTEFSISVVTNKLHLSILIFTSMRQACKHCHSMSSPLTL
jgi:hypothetical protein